MTSDEFVLLLALLVNIICTAAFSVCSEFLITEFQGSPLLSEKFLPSWD